MELAALSSSLMLEAAVASALGVTEEPGRSLGQSLEGWMLLKTLLLVLDNCEHLIEGCAVLSESLLTHCPGLRILATSREALAVPGEATYRVPSMALPRLKRLPADAEDLLRFDAVRLFVERATAAERSFQITSQNARWVVDICTRLDGIPLALELAAARVRAVSLPEIARRLDDCFSVLSGGPRMASPRQRTLRAALDWSYDLLTDEDKTLLRRLSVFAGG